LDITNNGNLHGFKFALQKSRTVTLGQMTLPGSNLQNAEMASQFLGIKPVRLVFCFFCLNWDQFSKMKRTKC